MFFKIKRLLYYIFIYPYYKIRFRSLGTSSKIISPLLIHGPKNIEIGSNVYIGYKAWLGALPLTGNRNCRLIIEDGVYIGNYNHIYATSYIRIGTKTMIADKVYIADNQHSFDDITQPFFGQPIKQLKEVSIGEWGWIGENVCIIGASIGKSCIIGANSVVTKDIPDYCIAVGSPAKIIKRFCFDDKIWKKTTPNGDFMN